MSSELAQEKGVFALWGKSSYVQEGFRTRNVANTCIAPTGTIQQICNTSSSGCEPIFAITYKRIQTLKDGTKQEVFWVNPFFKECAEVNGFWSDDLPKLISENRGSVKGIKQIPVQYQELFETAMEISPRDHVLMQAALQKWVDNSISKTINLPNEATIQDVYDAYMLGWKSGVRGMTVYRDGSRFGQVLSVGDQPEKQELQRGQIKKAPQESNHSKTVRLDTGCGTMYLTMTKDEDGNIDQTFVSRGSKGTCISNQTAVSRLISLSLRGGIPIDNVIDQLMSVMVCPAYSSARAGGKTVSKGSSCPTAIAYELQKYANEDIELHHDLPVSPEVIKNVINNDNPKTTGKCPKCGEPLTYAEHCVSCPACGYSACS
jgi:ribonucleoside-diphosphate reductase alpha chain